jgi:PAS domain S-box-containing protein
LSDLSAGRRVWVDSGRVSAGISLLVIASSIAVFLDLVVGSGAKPLLDAAAISTRLNGALCFFGLAAALLLRSGHPSGRRALATRVLAWSVIALAGATLFEYVASVNLGIDQLFVATGADAGPSHPGRILFQSAVAFILAGVGVLLIGRRPAGFQVTQALGVVCGGIGVWSLLGLAYGIQSMKIVGLEAPISLQASLAFAGFGVALIAADGRHTLVRVATDPGIAGQTMRRFVPAAALVVPVGAWLRLVGERAGLFDAAGGAAIMVGLEALLLLVAGGMITSRAARIEAERREAQADLIRLGAAASTSLIETAPVGLAVLDRELRYLYLNPALAAIGGVSPLASLGRRIDRVVPAVGPEHIPALESVLETGVAIRDHEVSGALSPAGKVRTLLLSAEPLRDQTGEPMGLAMSVVEITERKHREGAQAAITELRRQAHAIGESIPFGIWVADTQGGMRYLSESFLGMTGLTMELAGGLGWMSALAPETADEVKTDWAEAMATQCPWNRELMLQDSEGRRRTVLSRGLPVRDEMGTVTSWAGINLDITERKDAEAFREAFMGILSHELRTPITSIYAASTLLSRPGLDPDRQSELLDDIGHEAERLRRLVEDIVILARTERGTIQVHTEPVSLQRILPRVCDQEQRRWPEIRFELTIAASVPVARADETIVEQIVRNLLGNAAKYGPPDGRVELIADVQDGWPRVRVLDRGPGVDPAEAERLFEVFYRSERTAKVAGSGIGLFVAQRLVESIGGSIWARARDDGSGAEFGFRLQPLIDDVAEHL